MDTVSAILIMAFVSCAVSLYMIYYNETSENVSLKLNKIVSILLTIIICIITYNFIKLITM